MSGRLPVLRGSHAALLVAVAWGCATAAPPAPPPDVAVRSPAVAGCAEPEACFLAARAAIERGETSAGRERLLLIQRQWPGTPWAGRATLLLAKLVVESEPESAREWALQAVAALPLVGDRALALAAEAARKTGRPAEAATHFDALVRQYPESSLVASALWSAAESWAGVKGREGEAIARYLELGARFPQDSRAPSALAAAVSLAESAERSDEAGTACRKLVIDFPASPEAAAHEERCDRLIRAGAAAPLTFDEQRRRAELLGRAAKFTQALEVWRDLQRAAPAPGVRHEVDLQTAITLYRLRRWDDAGRAFRRLASSNVDPALREEARLWEGRAAFRLEDGRALRRAGRALAQEFPGSPRRLELIALWAVWARGRGDLDGALAAYQELARTAAELGRPDKAVEAYWNMGWLAFRQGRLDAARAALARGLQTAAPSEPQVPQLLYWAARLDGFDAANDASRNHDLLTSRFALTYYGLLTQRGSIADPAGGAAPIRALDGAATWSGGDGEPSPPESALPERAAELLFLGWRDDARDELLLATRRSPPAPDRAAEVADTLARLGADDEALRLVRRHFAPALERGDPSLPATVWHRAYPAHLLDAIRRRAERRVDPFLVAALIREESVYDPRAVSPVGAIGLMQLMPDTGRRVAAAVGLTGFSVEQLYAPEVNLTVGVRYLADLLDRFEGNEAYAVAAYNAGPEAVTRWLENGPPRSIEEFIEEIPFPETRGYVKRVLRSAWVYRALYGAGGDRVARAAQGSRLTGSD